MPTDWHYFIFLANETRRVYTSAYLNELFFARYCVVKIHICSLWCRVILGNSRRMAKNVKVESNWQAGVSNFISKWIECDVIGSRCVVVSSPRGAKWRAIDRTIVYNDRRTVVLVNMLKIDGNIKLTVTMKEIFTSHSSSIELPNHWSSPQLRIKISFSFQIVHM